MVTAEKLIVRDRVTVLMGAWNSTYTLAVMPKLMEYGVPMVVETSSAGKITSSGNPWTFRISPTSAMEAAAMALYIKGFSRQRRHSWARLLKKLYEVDPLACPQCGCRMAVIAIIEESDVIRKILQHLNLWERPQRLLLRGSFLTSWRACWLRSLRSKLRRSGRSRDHSGSIDLDGGNREALQAASIVAGFLIVFLLLAVLVATAILLHRNISIEFHETLRPQMWGENE